jgi:hypothetical protein
MVSKRSLNMSALNNGFRPRLVNFLPPGIGIDVGHHAAVEDRLRILPAIVDPIQADNCSTQVDTNGTGYSCHDRQCVAEKRRFIVVAGSRDKWRDDIAIPVAEGNDLIALDLLMPVEADVVAPFFAAVVVPSP